MLTAVCVPCSRTFRCSRNEVSVVESGDDLHYQSGDMWTCPTCKTSIVIGFGKPITKHVTFTPDVLAANALPSLPVITDKDRLDWLDEHLGEVYSEVVLEFSDEFDNKLDAINFAKHNYHEPHSVTADSWRNAIDQAIEQGR